MASVMDEVTVGGPPKGELNESDDPPALVTTLAVTPRVVSALMAAASPVRVSPVDKVNGIAEAEPTPIEMEPVRESLAFAIAVR